MDLKFHPDLESIPFNFKVYLYDPLNDRYFYQSHKIDHPNLKMIQKDDQHSFVPIFTSDARVAYFNTQKMQLELLNKNPFMKELHRLSPSVFSNGQDIYYFRKYKTFSSTLFMDFSELCSTTSEIRVLKNVPIDGWHKAEELWIPHHEYPGTQFKGRF